MTWSSHLQGKDKHVLPTETLNNTRTFDIFTGIISSRLSTVVMGRPADDLTAQ